MATLPSFLQSNSSFTRAVVMTKPRLCQIETIVIDVTRDETHTLANTVTDHPVEEGFNISDHVRPNADLVSLTCFVSNTPLSQTQVQRAIEQGSFKFSTTAAAKVQIGAIDGRAAAIFKQLEDLRNAGTLVQLITTLKQYSLSSTQGMVIESLTIPRTSKNYDGLEWTMSMKQIRIVRNKQTRAPIAKDKRTPPKVSTGAQVPQPEQRDSYLLQSIEFGQSLAK